MNGLIIYISLMFNSVIKSDHVSCDFEIAIKHFNNTAYNESISSFDFCLDDSEFSTQSHFYLGIIYRNLNQLEKSRNYLKIAQNLDKGNINYYLEYATTLERLGEFNHAQGLYKEAVKIQKEHLGANLGLARMLHWKGEIKESIKFYRKLKVVFLENIAVDLGLGFVLMADYQIYEAKKIFNSIIEKDPVNASAKEGLAMLQNIQKHNFQYVNDFIEVNETSHSNQSISFKSIIDSSWQWGFEVMQNEANVNTPLENGLSINRQVSYHTSIFGLHKFNQKHAIFSKLAYEKLADESYQRKIQLESSHKLNDKNNLFIGLVSSSSQAKNNNNTLSYFGYGYQKDSTTSVMGRFFYSADKEFNDRQSVVLNINKSFMKKHTLEIGSSISKSNEEKSYTVFSKFKYQLAPNKSVFVNAIKNLTNHDEALSFGINYAF